MSLDSWQSDRLRYGRFDADEAPLLKLIFDANADLADRDPTFGIYPVSEFVSLLDQDVGILISPDCVGFHVRKILLEDRLIGYLQFEVNQPAPGRCWLPMLVLHPAYQRGGYGHEAVASLLSELRAYSFLETIGLNVYAANADALRFWFQCGFDRLLGVDRETVADREFTCITIERSLRPAS